MQPSYKTAIWRWSTSRYSRFLLAPRLLTMWHANLLEIQIQSSIEDFREVACIFLIATLKSDLSSLRMLQSTLDPGCTDDNHEDGLVQSALRQNLRGTLIQPLSPLQWVHLTALSLFPVSCQNWRLQPFDVWWVVIMFLQGLTSVAEAFWWVAVVFSVEFKNITFRFCGPVTIMSALAPGWCGLRRYVWFHGLGCKISASGRIGEDMGSHLLQLSGLDGRWGLDWSDPPGDWNIFRFKLDSMFLEFLLVTAGLRWSPTWAQSSQIKSRFND